jgi:hypothetical protein
VQIKARRLLVWLWPAALYMVVTSLTNAHYVADTNEYIQSLTTRLSGGDLYFVEFGHLIWRPLAWLLFLVLKPVLPDIAGLGIRAQLAFSYMSISWVAGLACLYLIYGILRELKLGKGVAEIFTVFFFFIHGIINFSQSGAPYVPGLACLLAALYIHMRASSSLHATAIHNSWKPVFLSGFFAASAVLFWVLHGLGLAFVVLLPLVLCGYSRSHIILAARIAIMTGLFISIAYGLAIWHLGITSYSEFQAWIHQVHGQNV